MQHSIDTDWVFSRRSATGGGPNAVAEALARARAGGRALLDLTLGNPTQCGLHYPAREVLAAISTAAALRYEPHSLGLPDARRTLSLHWGAQGLACEAERLFLTASTSEAYGYLFKLLCDPGDEVLVPAPSYPLFAHLARLDCVNAIPYRLGYDGAWHIDFDSIDRARTPRTRALLVVNPNNPTGSFVQAYEKARLQQLGLPLISDEVFLPYPLGGHVPASVGEQNAPVLTFVLDGLSKSVGLPQLKLGWVGVFGPERERTEALERLELIADTYLSVGAAVQAGLSALLAAGAQVREQIKVRTHTNLAALRSQVREQPVSALPVQGGWYAIVRLPSLMTEQDWVVRLVEEHAVSVQPGWFYDLEGGPHVVVSLLTPPDVFEQGIAAVLRLVQKHAG